MDDRYTTASAALGRNYEGEDAAVEQLAPLHRIRARIEANVQALDGIGDQLRAHANRVSGSVPEDATAKRDEAAPNSALAEIEQALAELDRAVSFVSYQAGRNCTLA